MCMSTQNIVLSHSNRYVNKNYPLLDDFYFYSLKYLNKGKYLHLTSKKLGYMCMCVWGCMCKIISLYLFMNN